MRLRCRMFAESRLRLCDEAGVGASSSLPPIHWLEPSGVCVLLLATSWRCSEARPACQTHARKPYEPLLNIHTCCNDRRVCVSDSTSAFDSDDLGKSVSRNLPFAFHRTPVERLLAKRDTRLCRLGNHRLCFPADEDDTLQVVMRRLVRFWSVFQQVTRHRQIATTHLSNLVEPHPCQQLKLDHSQVRPSHEGLTASTAARDTG